MIMLTEYFEKYIDAEFTETSRDFWIKAKEDNFARVHVTVSGGEGKLFLNFFKALRRKCTLDNVSEASRIFSMAVSILAYSSPYNVESFIRSIQSYMPEVKKTQVLEHALGIMLKAMDNVYTNVYTDSDGCTYNSITFKD